jgi:GntR family transcriptional regulator, galactonate operon transcriptional repressor
MLLRTLHQETVDRIAHWIVGGRFADRSALPTEDEIGGELGVSRTVVREAMRTLVAKGMVEVRRRHGTTVRPIDSWSLFDPQVVAWRVTGGLTRDFVDDLIHFRLGIEPHAAALAARNPAFDAKALEDAYRRMANAVDGDGDYHAADLDFHQSIILGSNNQFLRQLVPLLANTLSISFKLSVISMDTARASLPMHREVADAIIEGEPDRARKALTKLIEAAREDILGVLPDMLWEERSDVERNRLPVQGP